MPRSYSDYTPFTLGNRFSILPSPESSCEADRIPLVMARGAFGSGEHETTASCLEILETLPEVVGSDVLDFGSGTGILALAALKLGARHALCIDIAPEAVATAEANAAANDLAAATTHLCGSIDALDTSTYSLVLANIYGDLLLKFAPDLVARTRPGGLLLLSGILWEYNFDVRQRFCQLGCDVVSNRLLDEFSTVLLRKAEGEDVAGD